MTGFGKAEVSYKNLTVSVEVKSVNNRHLEFNFRLPRILASRESDVKEIIRKKIGRGFINCSVKLERENGGAEALSIDTHAAKTYYALLNQLRKTVKLREPVKLQHLLSFSEIFESQTENELTDGEWNAVRSAIEKALDALNQMRRNEGKELEKDLRKRLGIMNDTVDKVETLVAARIPQERDKLRERIRELAGDTVVLDANRLEMEISLLADKLDVTEECVRFRSHTKFFADAMKSSEPAGRKLNFLIQELNREANTIASKSNDAEISQIVVGVKEEMERVREQIQNLE